MIEILSGVTIQDVSSGCTIIALLANLYHNAASSSLLKKIHDRKKKDQQGISKGRAKNIREIVGRGGKKRR